MPAERASMRKVREVLRLRHALGVSERQIAITVGVSRSTVGEYLRRAAVIGITWPVPERTWTTASLSGGCSRRRRSRRSQASHCPIGAMSTRS
jgi:transposase